MFINSNSPKLCFVWCFLISLGIWENLMHPCGITKIISRSTSAEKLWYCKQRLCPINVLTAHCLDIVWGLVASKMYLLLYVHMCPYIACMCMYKYEYRIVSWRHKYRGYHLKHQSHCRVQMCFSCLLTVYILVYILDLCIIEYLSIYLSISIHPSLHQSILTCIHPSIYLPLCLSVCLSLCYLSIYLYI